MIRFGFLILVLLVSLSYSLPTCNISYWVNSKNLNCTASPNGTYSALNYNGKCSLSPDDPKQTSYQLLIDVTTKTVQNFTVYYDKTCNKIDTKLITKAPLSLDTCGPLFFATSPTSFAEIGSLIFNCKG